jgi:hypothetical protein
MLIRTMNEQLTLLGVLHSVFVLIIQMLRVEFTDPYLGFKYDERVRGRKYKSL